MRHKQTIRCNLCQNVTTQKKGTCTACRKDAEQKLAAEQAAAKLNQVPLTPEESERKFKEFLGMAAALTIHAPRMYH